LWTGKKREFTGPEKPGLSGGLILERKAGRTCREKISIGRKRRKKPVLGGKRIFA